MDTVGDYELEGPIGTGTSATVWRAHRVGAFSRTVALKRAAVRSDRSASASREGLLAEATLLADLDHPHIVHVVDVLDDGDGVAIVMPLAHGGSLLALLDERRTLTAGEVVAVIAPVADALASAHRRGLVHGDVKPANILLTADGEPLLSDFGAARHVGRSAPGQPFAATAAYLDPELLVGAAPSPRHDLYSLGLVCHEALLGRLPDGGSINDPSVPDRLRRVVEQAIRPDARQRQADMEEFAESLRRSVDPASMRLPGTPLRSTESATEVGVHGTRQFGPRPPPPAPATGPAMRRRMVALAAVCTLAAASVGAVWLWREHHTDSRRHDAAVPVHPRRCLTFPALDAAHGTQRFRVDLSGDGCPAPVTWDGHVLAARFAPSDRAPRYYAIGRRGDVMVFGDWDCDGAETPALYRPGAGEVIYVNSFASRVGDRTYAARTARRLPRRGTPRVGRGTGGCQVVRIERTRA